MKKNILLFFIMVAILLGCKKSEDKPQNCEVSISGIIGTYKITNIISTDAGIPTDITDSYLDPCEKNGIYVFKADETVEYTESSAGCSYYDVGYFHLLAGNKINFDAGAVAILNVDIINNCSNIVISGSNGGPTHTYTFTKQ